MGFFSKSREFGCLHRSLSTLSQSHKFRSRCPTLTRSRSQSLGISKAWSRSRSRSPTKNEDSASLMNIPFNYVFTINIGPNRAGNKKRSHRLNGNRWVNSFDPLDACDAPVLVTHLTLFDPIYPLSSLSDIQRC